MHGAKAQAVGQPLAVLVEHVGPAHIRNRAHAGEVPTVALRQVLWQGHEEPLRQDLISPPGVAGQGKAVILRRGPAGA